MNLTKATYRYGKTFFDHVRGKNKLEEAVSDMQFLASVIGSTPALKKFLASPINTHQQFQAVFLDKLKDKLSPLTLQFIQLLIRKNRAEIIPEIPFAVIEYYEAHKNILRAEIKSVHKLSDEQLSKIRAKLIASTGASDIQIKNIVDPRLIAGFKIQIGDSVIEATVRNKLIQLKRKLAA